MAEVNDLSENEVNETTVMKRDDDDMKEEKSNEKNEPIATSHELALMRTYLACERTFLASIRTNSIFAGLSLLLTNNNQHIPSVIILILCIAVNICTTYTFYRSSQDHNFKTMNQRTLHLMQPIFYSLLLTVVLIILLYLTIDQL